MKTTDYLFLLAYLFFLNILPCYANYSSIDTIEITGEIDSLFTLTDQQLWVFCDTTHQMKYEEIQALDLKAFKPTNKGKYGLALAHANHYWFRFVVKNNHLTKNVDLVLNIYRVDYGNLYQKTENSASIKLTTEKNIVYKERYYTYRSIPIILTANQTTDFLFINKFKGGAHDNFRFLLTSKRQFEKKNLKNIPRNLKFNLFQGLFYGFIFFASLFAFIQFIIERDITYFYYSIYLLSIFFYYLMATPYLSLATLPFSKILELGNPYIQTLTFAIVSTYALFLRAFLNINSSKNKIFSRIFSLLQLGLLFILMIDFCFRYNGQIVYYPGLHSQIRFILLGIGFCIIPAIFYIARKEQYSLFIVIGTLLLLLSGLFSNLYVNGTDHIIREYMSVTQMGVLLEILFFSLGLSLRSRNRLIVARNKEIITNQELNQEKLAKVQIQKDQALFKQKLAETELKALRAQINPHFISNALNAIKQLIQTNQGKKAADYLADFSSLIRTILINSNEQFISIQKELDYCRQYLKIESLRFDNGFSYLIEVDKSIDTTYVKLPPLILQPYIENAIWHGLLSKSGNRELTIQVKDKGDYVCYVIEDNGIGRKAAIQLNKTTKKSYGLSITNERIKVNNTLYEAGLSVKIIDKKDKLNKPLGTRIELTGPL